MLTESKSYIFLIAQSIILLILMIVAVSSVDGGWTEIFQCQIYTSNWNNQPDSRTITVEGPSSGGGAVNVFSILTLIFGELAVIFGFVGTVQKTFPKAFLIMLPCLILSMIFNIGIIMSAMLAIGFRSGQLDSSESLFRKVFGWDGQIESVGRCNYNPNNNHQSWQDGQDATCQLRIQLSNCWRYRSDDSLVAVVFLAFGSLIVSAFNIYYLNRKIQEQDWSVSELFRWAWLKLRNIAIYGFSGIHFSVSVTKRAFGLTQIHLKVKRKNDVLFREITIQRTDTLDDLHSAILRAFADASPFQVKQMIKNSEVLIERDDDIARLQSQDRLEVELTERQPTKLEDIPQTEKRNGTTDVV